VRVLIVSNLFPPDIGGPATYVPKIAGELALRGHQVAVVAGAPPEMRESDSPTFSFPVQRISRGLPLPRRLLAACGALFRAARGADVLYVQGLAGPEMVAVLVGRLLRKPVALKIVGDNAWEYAIRTGLTTDGIDAFQNASYGGKLRAVRGLVHAYARLVTRLIVPSEYLKGIVQGWGVAAERVVVIRNALTSASVRLEERAAEQPAFKRDLGVDGPLLVTSARLYPWKNLDFLIDLVPHLTPNLTLAIVGGGPDHAALAARAAAAGVADRVRITGNVSHEDVQRYLRAADVFVLNTRYEGLSHVMLEAMAAGAPVIASDVGGNPEVICNGENGVLVALDDGDAIAAAVHRLLTDHAFRDAITRRALEDVRDYRWDALVERTAAVLQGLRPQIMAPVAA
jgi:glycosyltransferase involved in cell wall biosynthesis